MDPCGDRSQLGIKDADCKDDSEGGETQENRSQRSSGAHSHPSTWEAEIGQGYKR